MLPDHLQRFAKPIPVLDKGFVRLVDVMGDDGDIVEAARVSTGKGRHAHAWGPGVRLGLRTCEMCGDKAEIGEERSGPCLEGDRRFLRYMVRQGHTSPFEMCEIKLHVKLPIFVARQWIRHRTGSFNEWSGRYSEMPDETFQVGPDGWRGQDTKNRQGSAGAVAGWPEGYSIEEHDVQGEDFSLLRTPLARTDGNPNAPTNPGAYLSWRGRQLHGLAREVYDERLAFGVSKELARLDLPLTQYTQWYWKTDLHNLTNFLRLRLDSHAQPEIQAYARAIRDIVAAWVPLAWEATRDWRVESATLSRQQLHALRQLFEGCYRPDVAAELRDYLKDVPESEIKDFLALLGVE